MNQISNVDMVELVKILNSKHITYFDWNVNSGDTADNCSVDDIVNNVTSVLPNMTIQLCYYMMIQTDQPRQRLLSRLLKA